MRIKRPHYDPAFKRKWREREPQLRRLVEETMPRMMQSFRDSRFEWIEDEWRTWVAEMQSSVHEGRKSAQRNLPEFAHLGCWWASEISHVANMIEYLFNVVRQDLGLSTGDTLASMLLVEQALNRLERELNNHSDKNKPNGDDANQYRIFRALEVLTPDFDDTQFQRLRALDAAEWSVRRMCLPADGNAEGHPPQSCKPSSHLEGVECGDFGMFGQSIAWAHSTRYLLASIDKRFEKLDALLVLEELGEADAESIGGRSSSGDGRLGPVRALAVLSVKCGALGFGKRKAETFDEAVDRARQVLMTMRSRVRRQLRAFRKKWRLSVARPYSRARSKRSNPAVAKPNSSASVRLS